MRCPTCGEPIDPDVGVCDYCELERLRAILSRVERDNADLLAACEAALLYFIPEKYQPDLYDDEGWRLHENAHTLLDAAIAKAKGETG